MLSKSTTTAVYRNTPMKKNLAITAILFAITSLVFGIAVRDAFAQKLLDLVVREFLNPKFISGLVEKNPPALYKDGLHFDGAYYEARERSYSALFAEDATVRGDDNRYYYLRTVAVAKFKEELHKGTTLMDVYQDAREEFKKSIESMPSEFKNALLALIDEASMNFTNTLNQQYRNDFVHANAIAAKERDEEIKNLEIQVLESLLINHKSAEEIVAAKEHGFPNLPVLPKPSAAFKLPKDLDSAKFAMRRFDEGGKELVGKYLTVLKLMRADVASTLK